MMDQPPQYSTQPPQQAPQMHPPQGQAVAYPPQQGQAVAYPLQQGQAVTYPPQQGQAVTYPPQQGQAVIYPPPQGQAVIYPTQGQAVPNLQPQTNMVVYAQGAQPVPTTYVYQNTQQQGCCSGVSERYNGSGGFTTGVIQLIIGILCIILTGVSYAFPTYNNGYGIWSAIMFYIPAGILGIVSKNRNSGVVISYLIMSILSSLDSFGMIAYEGVSAGIHAFVLTCGYSFYGYDCRHEQSTGAVVVHSLLAILAFVEFIVSIVGAAFCCNGLYCCCARPTAASTITTTTAYQNQPHTVVVAGSATQPQVETQSQAFTKQ